MATKSTDWRPGPTVCRCCLSEGCYKDISTEYFWMGKREVYAEMLLNSFNLTISYSQSGGPNSNSRLICEPCISRLRDATDFKRQVQECEKTFTQYLDPGVSSISETEVPIDQLDSQVKVEQVKVEKMASDDDDFDDRTGFDDDDDDDLDDQPLTKLASKVPKKESVDILDLLDNAKAALKRKSSTKTKSAPAKKSKTTKKEAKPTSSSSKTVKIEKKKKELRASGTSIWQLTIMERRNAVAFICYTTVRPFIFMGFTFKCFYCTEYHSEIKSLLAHTATHKTGSEEEILEKYVPKGKRTLQVDISKLNCKLCGEKYPNLDRIRAHLETEHEILFQPAGNGMTEYNTEIKNDVMACHVCGKVFHTFKLLNSHMNSHSVKVVCEDCGAGFLNQHKLMKHKEVHLTKKFECKFCNKVYYKKSQLKYHTGIVHEGKERVRPKKCPHCPQTFREHYSKMMHLKQVHGISKTFQCYICKSSFTTRRALTEHSNRIHTEKHKCAVCSKCFAIESKLKEHMICHTGERNFVCPVCKNAYVHNISLRKHMRIHDTEYKFVCAECGVGCHSKIEYSRHFKQWH